MPDKTTDTRLSDISTREEIHHLVQTFYDGLRKDDMLGPIFNRAIPDALWPWHINHLTDFWESALLGHYTYVGNPKTTHQSVDRMEHGTITMEHFGRWIQHWFATIDSLYAGPRADHAKTVARKMSSALFISIVEGRKEKR